ncbi:MAG TPA: hypothetical protein VFO53_02545, partial [Casimicrobiaceae bacterium]|nr:hypothetical protein [Casimicrobiaceae bacterium]
MAKLTDLKALLDAATPAAPAVQPPVVPAPPARRTPARASDASARRIATGKRADGDIDLREAFSDVTRLPPRNRVAPARARPLPHARLRMEDER